MARGKSCVNVYLSQPPCPAGIGYYPNTNTRYAGNGVGSCAPQLVQRVAVPSVNLCTDVACCASLCRMYTSQANATLAAATVDRVCSGFTWSSSGCLLYSESLSNCVLASDASAQGQTLYRQIV
jgi:hypothetical protein